MLPAETERVWAFLKGQSALEGFVLIGGTALALQINHRRSEDLDLAFKGVRLPRPRLDALRAIASDAGFTFTPNDNEAAIREFADSTLELHDYQQDFLVNKRVKLSFFVPDQPFRTVLDDRPSRAVRVASLSELFKTKCLVSAMRSRTRDWLDLFLLLRDHGFTIQNFAETFKQAGIESQLNIALARLCTGRPQVNDEGYLHLLTNPPSLQEMQKFFMAERDRLEIATDAEAARRKPQRE